MEQFTSGGLNFTFEINLHKYTIGLMRIGNFVWQQEDVQKRRSQYCFDNFGTILHLRALQGHSVDYSITCITLDVRSIFIQ